MWGLVYKDFYLLQKAVLWAMGIGAFGPLVVYKVGAAGMLVICTSAIAYFFIVTSLYHEERNNSLSFLKMLPLPPARIVEAKFLEFWLVILFSFLYGILVVAVARTLGLVEFNLAQIGWGILLATTVNVIGFSFFLWLFFRLGYQKVRIGLFVFWFMLYALGFLASQLRLIAERLGLGAVPSKAILASLLIILALASSFLFLALARRDFCRREFT